MTTTAIPTKPPITFHVSRSTHHVFPHRSITPVHQVLAFSLYTLSFPPCPPGPSSKHSPAKSPSPPSGPNESAPSIRHSKPSASRPTTGRSNPTPVLTNAVAGTGSSPSALPHPLRSHALTLQRPSPHSPRSHALTLPLLPPVPSFSQLSTPSVAVPQDLRSLCALLLSPLQRLRTNVC